MNNYWVDQAKEYITLRYSDLNIYTGYDFIEIEYLLDGKLVVLQLKGNRIYKIEFIKGETKSILYQYYKLDFNEQFRNFRINLTKKALSKIIDDLLSDLIYRGYQRITYQIKGVWSFSNVYYPRLGLLYNDPQPHNDRLRILLMLSIIGVPIIMLLNALCYRNKSVTWIK